MFIKVNSDFVVNTDHIIYIGMNSSEIYMDDGSIIAMDKEHRDAVMTALVKINNMTIVR